MPLIYEASAVHVEPNPIVGGDAQVILACVEREGARVPHGNVIGVDGADVAGAPIAVEGRGLAARLLEGVEVDPMVILCHVFAFGARRVLNPRAYGKRDK